MENMTCRSAIGTDRALTAVHGGAALLGLRTRTAAPKQTPLGVSFVAVPAYVVDQESHSPRGSTA